jgi:hypothetical protein
MKKLFFGLLTVLMASFVFAQTSTEEIDLVQSIYGIEKKAIVNDFVQPKAETQAAFWEVYDAYEVERKSLGKERIRLLEEFEVKYENMNNEDAEVWMKKALALVKKQDKLIVSYYNKVKKATSPIVAMRFYQVESFLLTAIRLEILDAIPFVEEK